jgi:hypothetical protein
MKELAPSKPFLRYFFPFDLDGVSGEKIRADNIDRNSKEGNVLCTEAQDPLSFGVTNLPEWSTPTLRVKMGKTIKNYAPPVVIAHTCPGMEWRHASLPKAEFLYWASQIPANGGSCWTSFTGFPATIEDKRMLSTVGELNRMIQKVEADMEGAESFAQVLLLSDDGEYVQGWAEALLCSHVNFDMLAHYQFTYDRLKDYALVIAPKRFQYPQDAHATLDRYLNGGGKLIIEGTSHRELQPVFDLLGVTGPIVCSNELAATYMRIESPGKLLQDSVGDTGLVPLRGRVGFCEPGNGTATLVTWVPSFAPIGVVGNPPERASLPVPNTATPLCTLRDHGAGKVMFLAYEPSRLIREYALQDLYSIMDGYIRCMLGDDQQIVIDAPQRVMTSVFHKGNKMMVHFVNGIGQRPLQETIPCFNLQLKLQLRQRRVTLVQSRIESSEISYLTEDDTLTVDLPRLDVWNMLLVEFA